MAIERRPVVHGGLVSVVAVLLGLAGFFLTDSIQTNNTYDALAAHHVTVSERARICAGYICRYGYDYRGTRFTAVIGFGYPSSFVVDPRDPSLRMSTLAFDGGPSGTTGDDVFAGLALLAAVAVGTAHVVRWRRRRRLGYQPEASPWGVALAPEDDPVALPSMGPEPTAPSVVGPGQYLRLLPGEPLAAVDALPPHHNGRIQVLTGHGELVVDDPHERHTYRLPNAGGEGARIRGLVVGYADHRVTGHVNDPDRFLVVLGDQGQKVGRLDFSDTWELSTSGLRQMCRLSGLAFSVERYDSDRELLAARPTWVTPATELALEHPLAEDVRQFGLALWLGTGIALTLLGATGMELVFATPVRYVVFTIAGTGVVVAMVIAAWGRMTWAARQHRLSTTPTDQKAAS
jgi:hypothetical protein